MIASQGGGYADSVDVVYLFYSVPHTELVNVAKTCIAENSVRAFERVAAISVYNFTTLLECYRCSTFVTYEEKAYIQRNGIVIGSCVAPVLCDMFLAFSDRALAQVLDNANVHRVFRYVDDFLAVLKHKPSMTAAILVNKILKEFRQHAKRLSFTHKLPIDNHTQFLDMSLTLSEKHVLGLLSPIM